MEPPGRPDHQAGPMAGHRRQFPSIGRLVEREKQNAQARRVAIFGKQRVQAADPIRPCRDVGAHIGPAGGKEPAVGIASRAGMDLHHHAVLGRKTGHLGHHLPAEKLGVGSRKRTLQCLVEQGLLFRRRQICCKGCGHTVICRGRAELPEKGAPAPMRLDQAVPTRHVAPVISPNLTRLSRKPTASGSVTLSGL